MMINFFIIFFQFFFFWGGDIRIRFHFKYFNIHNIWKILFVSQFNYIQHN